MRGRRPCTRLPLPLLSLLSLLAVVASVAAPSVARAGNKCVEVSDVVGEQVCTSYGDDWSVERKWPVTFRSGLRYAGFSPAGLTFEEQFKARDRPKGYKGYSFQGEALGTSSIAGLGLDGGATVFLTGQLYLGIDGGIALGAFESASFTAGGQKLSDAGGADVVLLHGGVPVGYRIPLGRASIRSEVLIGGVMGTVAHSAEVDGDTKRKSAAAFRGLIEPRIAGDIWFTQHVSFGVYAGVNVLDTGGHAMGLSLTWHNRAFDGDMSIW